MKRRSFFGTLLGGLLARFVPKPAIKHRYPSWGYNGFGGDLGHDCLRSGCDVPIGSNTLRIPQVFTGPVVTLGPFPVDSAQAETMRKIMERGEADRNHLMDILAKELHES